MLAPISAQLGYAWVYDPQFTYRHFSTLGYQARFQHVSLVGAAWLAADDDNQWLRQRLDWSPERYGSAREALIVSGRIQSGRGRGGSVSLV